MHDNCWSKHETGDEDEVEQHSERESRLKEQQMFEGPGFRAALTFMDSSMLLAAFHSFLSGNMLTALEPGLSQGKIYLKR